MSEHRYIATIGPQEYPKRVDVTPLLALPDGFVFVRTDSGETFRVHKSKLEQIPMPPYRFSEANFRKYEPALHEILLHYPEVTIFTPTSVETFSCRLRDAVKAALANPDWVFHIDRGRLQEVAGDLTVAIKDKTVVVGSKEKVKEPGQTTFTLSPSLVSEPQHYDVVRSLCVLLAARILTGPIRVRVCVEHNLDKLRSDYDVFISKPQDDIVEIM